MSKHSGMVNATEGKDECLAMQSKGVKSAIERDGFAKADGDGYNKDMEYRGQPGQHKIKGAC